MKKMKFYEAIPLLFLILSTIFVGCAPKSVPAPPSESVTIPVNIAPITESDCSIPIHTVGVLASKTEMKLSFKIGGIIKRMAVDEGQIVSKGQLLAQLNLAEIDSQVEKARSMFQKTKRDLKRIKNLYKDKAVTLENLQDSRTALDVARSQLKAAEFNYRHATIRAPSKGKILKRFVEENEIIGPGMPVFYFASLDGDWITRVSVADRDILSIGLNDPATIEYDAYPGRTFSGHVSEIAEAASPESGLFEVELQMEATDLPLKSGLIAHVTIQPHRTIRCLKIPLAAVVEADGTQASIYIPDKTRTKAIKQIVLMKHIYDDYFAADIPEHPIHEVITDGAQYCIDGSAIAIAAKEGDKRVNKSEPDKMVTNAAGKSD